MSDLPFITRARSHAERVAFRTAEGTNTYQQLLDRSAVIALALLAHENDLKDARVALLVAPGLE